MIELDRVFFLETLLAETSDGIIVVDAEGVVTHINQSTERILERSAAHFIGKTLIEINEDSVGISESERRIRQQAIDGQQYIETYDEWFGKTLSARLKPIYDQQQIYKGTLILIKHGAYISNVSHEFRTPITPIIGYTDMLLLGALGPLSEEQKRILRVIKSNVKRLAVLIEDVFDISQIDAGHERIKPVPVNIPDTVKMVIDRLRDGDEHRNKPLSVEVWTQPELPPIEADQSKITRVLYNVISNAFNYTRDYGSIYIRLHCPDDEHIMIEVEDTGVGIPAYYHDRVWQRFERHDETVLMLDVPGTGLGLPIARALVEMHGGEIWFESGDGTTFYVTLPLKQDDPD